MKKSRSKSTPAEKCAAVEIQAAAVQSLAAAMPHNTSKRKEFGRDNAVAPSAGQTIEPSSELVSASTVSEANRSAKTGGKPAGDLAPGRGLLDRLRVDDGATR